MLYFCVVPLPPVRVLFWWYVLADVTVPYNLGESFLDFRCGFRDEIVAGCLFGGGMCSLLQGFFNLLLGPIGATVNRASGSCVGPEDRCGWVVQSLGGWVHEADGRGLTEF